MNPIVLRCPACNGEIKLDAAREFGFCEYCGTKIFMNTVQEVSGTVNVSRRSEVENLLARAREFERAGDFYQAESYYNRVLDIDVNDSRAKEGYQRVRSIVTEPNVFISRMPSNHDPAVKLVVKQNGDVLGKISRGAGMALMLPVGVHTLQLNLGDSKKQVTFRISTRHDRVNITSRSKLFGHDVTCDGLSPSGSTELLPPERCKSSKSRLLLFLLWMLCGGIFPFYYWYAGQKAGFFRFITLNWFFIGGMVDFFRIIFGGFKDQDGYRI